MEAGEQLKGAIAHLRFAQPAETAGELAAGEDVGGHRQIGKRQHLLMDEADAARQRIAGARERDRLARDPQLAAIGP